MNTTDTPEPDLCDHVGEERHARTAHGFLGDAPRGTVQVLCDACGTVVSQAEEPLARTRVHWNPNYAVYQNADGTLDYVKHAKF